MTCNIKEPRPQNLKLLALLLHGESLEVNSAQALSMDLCAHALASARCVPSRR